MNTSQIKERILSEQRKYDNEHYPKDFWAESAANKITGDIITLLKEHADCKKWHRINKPEGYYMHTYISYIIESLSQPSDSGTAHPQPDMQITNKEGSAQWRLGELKTKRKDRDDLKEESPKHAPRNGFGCKGKQECCSLEEFQTYGCDCPCHKQDDKLGCDGWGDSVRDKDGVIIIDECGCSCHNKKEEEE